MKAKNRLSSIYGVMVTSPLHVQKKMTNKELVDFLSEQFDVSRTTAKDMLHILMKCKAEDNFKKRFSGRNKNESVNCL